MKRGACKHNLQVGRLIDGLGHMVLDRALYRQRAIKLSAPRSGVRAGLGA